MIFKCFICIFLKFIFTLRINDGKGKKPQFEYLSKYFTLKYCHLGYNGLSVSFGPLCCAQEHKAQGKRKDPVYVPCRTGRISPYIP